MWKTFCVALVAVCAVCCSPSCSAADDIVVSTDGSSARRITVRVENGNRALLGRLFNRRGGATGAGSGVTAPPAPAVLPSPAPERMTTMPRTIPPTSPAPRAVEITVKKN